MQKNQLWKSFVRFAKCLCLLISITMLISLIVLIIINAVSSRSFQNKFPQVKEDVHFGVPQIKQKNNYSSTQIKEKDNNFSFTQIEEKNDDYSFPRIKEENEKFRNQSEFFKIVDEEEKSVNFKTLSELKQEILFSEDSLRLGFSVVLSEKEQLVNVYLKRIKDEEFRNLSEFLAAGHFFDVRDRIEKSRVFQFIRKIPKGGLLHVHQSAFGSSDILFELTKEDNLYICNKTGNLVFKFHNGTDNTCKWKKLKNLRPNSDLDESIKRSFTMFGNQINYKRDSVWKYFESVFTRIHPILKHKPVFEKYFQKSLEENYDDNINYIEIRGTFNTVYQTNGEILDAVEVAGIVLKIVDEFKKLNPNFFGLKLIYSPQRNLDRSTLEKHVETALKIKQKYPDLISGFDLIGQEDDASSLNKCSHLFKKLPFNLFLHAGETNFFGLTDNNLYDAVLFNNTKRIGHGLALIKHPKILNLIKQKRIAVEVSPISNQVLKFVEDLRNHPASVLMANNFDVVICNDDPGIWGAKGVSYDWYFAFMALGHKADDLKLLKKFALNSIEFSGLGEAKKSLFKEKWERLWDLFIDDMLTFIYK